MKKVGVNKIGQFDYQQILAGDFQRVAYSFTLKAGQVYKLGSVIGLDAGGKGVLVGNDSVTDIFGILAEEVDATAEDQVATVFLTGEFAQERMIFGGTATAAGHWAAARNKSIFFKATSIRPNQ